MEHKKNVQYSAKDEINIEKLNVDFRLIKFLRIYICREIIFSRFRKTRSYTADLGENWTLFTQLLSLINCYKGAWFIFKKRDKLISI